MRRAVGCGLGTWLVLWACYYTVAKDIPISSNYVIKKQDSCPEVGYYFRREPSPNAVYPGPCLLCFCKEPGTAACWVRDTKRCDVENYTLNTTDSDALTRVRRSPLGLGDIFFRDATRDFFAKNLPQQCKPNEESFSDGCPPADWCLGCTVCDCDANGRWDCHILSFCNEEEREKQLKGKRLPFKTDLKPSKNAKSESTKKTTKKPAKPIKKTGKPVSQAKKPAKKTKKPAKPAKKPTRQAKTSTKTTKPVNRTQTGKPIRKVIKRVIKKVNKDDKVHEGQSKKPKRRIIIKKRANNKTIIQKRENPKQLNTKKLNKKHVETNSAQMTSGNKINLPPNLEYQMGQMLVKKVMSSVQKMVNTELDRINKTAIEKGLSTSDCEDIHNKKKKEKSKDFKYRRIGQEFRWMRSKRDIGNASTTSIYDYGIATTTDLDTGPSVEIDNGIAINNEKDLVTTTTNKTLMSNINLKRNDNFDGEVFPLDKTAENNLLVKNYIGNNNETTLKFQIIVNDDPITTDQISQKNTQFTTSAFEDQFLVKLPITSNYQYNGPIDNSTLVVSAVNKDGNKDVNSIKTDTKNIKKGPKKLGLVKKVMTNGYKNLSNIYFPFKNVSIHRKVNFQKVNIRDGFNKTRKANKAKFFKFIKKLLNKLLRFGKRSNRLGQEDEYEIVKTICENMKSCNINKSNRKTLRNKIKKLNAETKSIFRTIKTIKGLLHLIDVPEINNGLNITNFKSDIKKVNAILKGNIPNNNNLTATQKTQIEYLKANTKTFILAVSKFTSLVNEVTAILNRNNKQAFKRNTRYVKKNITESFDKIKKILLKHNLVENTFIKKIYKMLTDLEMKVSNKTKVSDKRINSYVINKYSREIVDNLRKLRDLAQALNSSRRKRQISGEDNTMEYLLTLLEYLLKDSIGSQKNIIEPAQDGIDVLIETFRNAPDIKSIKKKALHEFSNVPNVTPTVYFKAKDENNSATIDSDQLSDSNSVSKESNSTSLNDTSKEAKTEAVEDTTELPKSGPDDEESQNSRRNSNHDFAHDMRSKLYQDSANDLRDSLYHDSIHDLKGNIYQHTVQDVIHNPYHDTVQELRGDPYQVTTQDVIGNLYHDFAQEMGGSPYSGQKTTNKDVRQNDNSNLKQNENTQNIKYNSTDGKAQNSKDNSSRNSKNVFENDLNRGEFENLKGITNKDVSFNETASPYNKGVTPYKDVKITQTKDAYDGPAAPLSLYEDATQLVRVIPFDDISQNVYYVKVDENATNYELFDNVTVPMTQTTTPETEKFGFDKFLKSIDADRKLGSDSEDEDTYPVGNRTRKTKVKDKFAHGKNLTLKYVDSEQSADSTGHIEWIEQNFGKELKELKDKKGITSRKSTTAKPASPTLTARVKQPLDFSDVSDDSDGKKEKKLSAEEVMYKKQMNLLNSLDYGTEKNEYEEGKSDDDDSMFA